VRLGLLVPAVFCILRLAAAEIEYSRATPESVARAISIGKTEYRERLAELQPARAGTILRQATAADPLSAAAWIRLGLAEEQRETPGKTSDFPARRALETAFRVDRQYAPAWALANYCLRHDDRACFWRAEFRAAVRAPQLADPKATNLGDLQPLLELARRMEPAPEALLEHFNPSAGSATEAPPAAFSAQLERAYLDDLIVLERWDDATTVALRIASHPVDHNPGAGTSDGKKAGIGDGKKGGKKEDDDNARLDDVVNRLIAAGSARNAVAVWNRYSGFAPLDPARGVLLTNGDFATNPRQSGFDWRLRFNTMGAVAGIEPVWKPSVMEFRFAGSEPEQGLLAEQWVPLAGGSFRLRFEYSTRNLAGPTGIRWEALDRAHDRTRDARPSVNPSLDHARERLLEPTPEPSLDPSMDWRPAQWVFSAPGARKPRTGSASVVPLRLIYRREPGRARAQGAFLLRHVRLEVL